MMPWRKEERQDCFNHKLFKHKTLIIKTMTKLKIYLFRHSQTYYNKKGRFTGWTDSKLTPFGKEQAKALAKKLKNKKFDVAFCTRLSRSKDTLKAVLKYHPECRKIIVDDRMIERSYGKFAGKSHKEVEGTISETAYKALIHDHVIDHLEPKERREFLRVFGEFEDKIIRRCYYEVPPGGESVKMVEKRVNAFIKDLLKMMKKEKVNVAISAHGNSMRPFRKHFEKMTIEEMMRIENPWDDYFEYTVNV